MTAAVHDVELGLRQELIHLDDGKEQIILGDGKEQIILGDSSLST